MWIYLRFDAEPNNEMSEKRNIPQHVAIIMDGNGRWAKAKGKERYEGHIEGVVSVKACIKAARKRGASL